MTDEPITITVVPAAALAVQAQLTANLVTLWTGHNQMNNVIFLFLFQPTGAGTKTNGMLYHVIGWFS